MALWCMLGTEMLAQAPSDGPYLLRELTYGACGPQNAPGGENGPFRCCKALKHVPAPYKFWTLDPEEVRLNIQRREGLLDAE